MATSHSPLPRIYTRTGDDATTGLSDGRRVRKDDACVAACGDVDELNSFIGLLATAVDEEERNFLHGVQHKLLHVGAMVAGFVTDGGRVLTAAVAPLEQRIDRTQAAAGERAGTFVLPGGCKAAALAHVCRTVCRRAERSLCTAAGTQPTGPAGIFLNRLSDYFYVLALRLNQFYETAEIKWAKEADL